MAWRCDKEFGQTLLATTHLQKCHDWVPSPGNVLGFSDKILTLIIKKRLNLLSQNSYTISISRDQ